MDPITISLMAASLLSGLNKSGEQQREFKSEQGVEAQKSRFAHFRGEGGKTMQRPSASDPIMQSLMASGMLAQGAKTDSAATGGIVEQNPSVSTGLGNGTADNFMGPPGAAVRSPGGMAPTSMYAGGNVWGGGVGYGG